MEDEKNVNEVKDQMEQLFMSSADKLQRLRLQREEMTERLQMLIDDNKEKAKRCEEFKRRISVAKGKSSQLKTKNSQLEQQKADLEQVLEARTKTCRVLDEKSVQLGTKMVTTLNGIAGGIVEKRKEYKSYECVLNGTNTLLFRAEEIKKQVPPLEAEIARYKAKIAEGKNKK